MYRTSVLIFIAAMLLLPQAWADTLVAEPVRDNTLYEDPVFPLSNGAGSYLFIGRTGDDKGVDRRLRRALLKFDLSDIPPGSQISSVELQLSIDTVPLQALAGTSSIHRLLSDWGEGISVANGPQGQGAPASPGDATWLHTFYDTGSWQTAGGDFAGASQTSPLSALPQTLIFPSSEAMVADVSSWVDQPESNFGWIVLGDEPVTKNARRLLSREHPSVESRPRLSVEYTPAVASQPVPTLGQSALIVLISLILLGGFLSAGNTKP